MPLYFCIGSCSQIFEDGHCTAPELPWLTEADFQHAEEDALRVYESEFYKHCPYDPHVEDEVDGHEVEYLEVDGVYMLYDADTNLHYFFIR